MAKKRASRKPQTNNTLPPGVDNSTKRHLYGASKQIAEIMNAPIKGSVRVVKGFPGFVRGAAYQTFGTPENPKPTPGSIGRQRREQIAAQNYAPMRAEYERQGRTVQQAKKSKAQRTKKRER